MRRILMAGIIAAGLVTLTNTAAPAYADVAPSVQQWLHTSEPGETAVLWVFFTDKGPYSEARMEQELRRVAAAYPQDAVLRRIKARGGRPFDERDLPIYRPYLEAVRSTGVEIRAFSRWLNGVTVEVTAAEAEAIAGLAFVRGMRRVSGRRGGPQPEPWPDAAPRRLRGDGPGPYDAPPSPALGEYGDSWRQLEQIQVLDLHSEGYTGTGIKVAVFDTGFWLEHEAFNQTSVIAEWDFINDDSVTANQPGDLENQHNHGTMCLSIIGGYSAGTLVGPAYDADFILAKTEDMSQEAPVEEDWWIEAAEWADSLGAQVISSSLCYNDWYTYEDMDGNTAPITIAADIAHENGIVVANAAGNSGASDWKYILAPADGFNVISVGSVDSTGLRSYWSSQGPTYDGRIKPTIMAMGQSTFIADPVGGTSSYRRGNGTSFATPLAAGAMALMLEKNPDWDSDRVLMAVLNTSTRASMPDTLYGYGILQAHAASDFDISGTLAAETAAPCVSIYPNPARTYFNIVYSGGVKRVGLYDVAGRLVREFHLSSDGVTRFDLASGDRRIPHGVYFLRAGATGAAKVLILK